MTCISVPSLNREPKSIAKKGLHLLKVNRNLGANIRTKKDSLLSIPDFQTFMLPVLRVAAEGEVRISDVVERLAGDFALSADDRSHLLPSGRQTTFANRVHWAKSYLGKAGLIELTKRAHFRITEDGRKVLAASPERIDIKYLNRFPSFQQFREAGGEEQNDETTSLATANTVMTLTPDEAMRNAHRQLEVSLAGELMQRIRSGTPAFFESLVVRLLVGMGYGGSVTDVSKALEEVQATAALMALSIKITLASIAYMCRPNDMPMATRLVQLPFAAFSEASTSSKPLKGCSSPPRLFPHKPAKPPDN